MYLKITSLDTIAKTLSLEEAKSDLYVIGSTHGSLFHFGPAGTNSKCSLFDDYYYCRQPEQNFQHFRENDTSLYSLSHFRN